MSNFLSVIFLIYSLLIICNIKINAILSYKEQIKLEEIYTKALCSIKNGKENIIKDSNIQISTVILETFKKRKRSEKNGSSYDKVIEHNILTRLKIKYDGPFQKKTFVILAATDRRTGDEQFLVNPHILQVDQGTAYKNYKLKLFGSTPAEAFEQIYNKDDKNFTGCVTSDYAMDCEPTCGKVKMDNQVLTYSEGFCCACNKMVNELVQPGYGFEQVEHMQMENVADDSGGGNPAKGKLEECNIFIQNRHRVDTISPYYRKKIEAVMSQLNLRKPRRQAADAAADMDGKQIRGGQDCKDTETPRGLDPKIYHSSAHCLRFSDLWYNIYSLEEKPCITESYFVKIFERTVAATAANEKGRWTTKTNETLNLNVNYPIIDDYVHNLKIILYLKCVTRGELYDRLLQLKLLMPVNLTPAQMASRAETRAGASEYLVVSDDLIHLKGDQCDRIGVSYEAFYNQQRRCSQHRGACLGNQPRHLWKHDHDFEKRHLQGFYFLKYYANVTNESLLNIDGQKYLKLEYDGKHITFIDIHMRGLFNIS